ncbi:MAG: helix-turn-helix domain-containing protein [Saccharofermentanales bacterium]
MKPILIGDKIKEIRLSRKLTQQEVVGDFITRNMLSKIENNAATPSVKTLEFLARKLGVPPGSLLGERAAPGGSGLPMIPSASSRAEAMANARNALRNNAPAECIHFIKEFSGEDLSDLPDEDCDEARILLAFAYLAQADIAHGGRDFRNAVRFAQDAIQNNKGSLYYNQTIDAKATLLLNNSILGI